VIVAFEPGENNLTTLIAIHLHMHSPTAEHIMQNKYRSAIYTFTEDQNDVAEQALRDLQADFDQPIITKILPFQSFRLNEENYLDYYYKDPAKPFCQNIVNPKLKELLSKFADQIAPECKTQLASL
jgi:peptide-methionine (S)-S-oxide reductase